MKITHTAGRFNGEVGVERVNRDGDMEILEKREDVEVTLEDRMKWYAKATLDGRGPIVDKIFPPDSKDDGGNKMNITDLAHRTSEPRPHQFSIERRLVEQRDPNSTESIQSEATLAYAMGMAFKEFVRSVRSGEKIDNAMLIEASTRFGLRVEDVFSLSRIAQSNTALGDKFLKVAAVPGEECEVCQDIHRKKRKSIPGVAKKVGPDIGKRSKPAKGEVLSEEELNMVAQEVGL